MKISRNLTITALILFIFTSCNDVEVDADLHPFVLRKVALKKVKMNCWRRIHQVNWN